MSSPKIAEAQECISRAEKSLKTSLLKWKPDLDNAASEYQKAANAYQAAKEFEKCIECCIKSADYFEQNKQYFSAAKNLEQAALIYGKELGDFQKAANLIEKSCHIYRTCGFPDTAALTFDRGAKMLEEHLPEVAADFYLKASETLMVEGRPAQAPPYSGKAARIFLKLKNYDAALKALNDQVDYYRETDNQRAISRLFVHIILVQLAKDDFVAARKAFQYGQCYIEKEELFTLSNLLSGYDEMNPKKVITALDSPFIKFLDTEYSRLARYLQQKQNTLLLSASSAKSTNEEDTANEDTEAGALL